MRAGRRGGAGALSGDYLFINNDAFVNRQGPVAAMAAALERDAVAVRNRRRRACCDPTHARQPTVVALQTPAVAFVRALRA